MKFEVYGNWTLVHMSTNFEIVHLSTNFEVPILRKNLWSGALPTDNDDDANTGNERENNREFMTTKAHYDEFK